jgi:hypothetical protein
LRTFLGRTFLWCRTFFEDLLRKDLFRRTFFCSTTYTLVPGFWGAVVGWLVVFEKVIRREQGRSKTGTRGGGREQDWNKRRRTGARMEQDGICKRMRTGARREQGYYKGRKEGNRCCC